MSGISPTGSMRSLSKDPRLGLADGGGGHLEVGESPSGTARKWPSGLAVPDLALEKSRGLWGKIQ
jgi:hypothetical protein